jgi:hypothetical protein
MARRWEVLEGKQNQDWHIANPGSVVIEVKKMTIIF